MARQFKMRVEGERSFTVAARTAFTEETRAAVRADINATQRTKIASGQKLTIGGVETDAGTAVGAGMLTMPY